MATTVDKVIIGHYNSYQEAFNDMERQGVKHLGWVNDGKTKVPDYLNCERAYKNWSGSSCLYVDPIYRMSYSVDMGD